jgi:hypothetical protein
LLACCNSGPGLGTMRERWLMKGGHMWLKRQSGLRHLCEEGGQDFAEYALILSLLVALVAAALSPFGINLAGRIVAAISGVTAFF